MAFSHRRFAPYETRVTDIPKDERGARPANPAVGRRVVFALDSSI